jgi:hypothetical protein
MAITQPTYPSTTSAVVTHVGAYTDARETAEAAARDAAIAAHTSDATAAHNATAIAFTPAGGIAATDAAGAIVEAKTDAEATAASALTTHAADTTAIHGIPDTSVLVDATDLSDAIALEVTARDAAVAVETTAREDAITAHEADTTAVHGIPDATLLPVALIWTGSAYPSRPASAVMAIFRGPGAPTIGGAGNAVDNVDIWIDTTA